MNCVAENAKAGDKCCIKIIKRMILNENGVPPSDLTLFPNNYLSNTKFHSRQPILSMVTNRFMTQAYDDTK